MSILSTYGITFYSKVINGQKFNFCQLSDKNYYTLSFIGDLSNEEVDSLIDELQCSINSCGGINDYFLSDSVEGKIIAYQYSNMVINNILTLPMTDLLQIAQAWLAFIS
jgi:hypothetical protein